VSESGDSPAACDNYWDGGPVLGGWQRGSGAPAGAAAARRRHPIAPAAGLVDSADGGTVFVFGQATSAFATEVRWVAGWPRCSWWPPVSPPRRRSRPGSGSG
jgi:hypothetical protein